MPCELNPTTIFIISLFLASLADSRGIIPLLYLAAFVLWPHTKYGVVAPLLEYLDRLSLNIMMPRGGIHPSDATSNQRLSFLYDRWNA